jgi:hypothetical protein
MASNSDRVIEIYVKHLHPSVRDDVSRRYQAMVREYLFMCTRKNSDLRSLRWSDNRFFVLFALNSFYQIVIGPLQSSARTSGVGIGDDIAIRRGRSLYGWSQKKRTEEFVADFMSMVTSLEFQWSWLGRNTTSELVFWIDRHELKQDPTEVD